MHDGPGARARDLAVAAAAIAILATNLASHFGPRFAVRTEPSAVATAAGHTRSAQRLQSGPTMEGGGELASMSLVPSGGGSILLAAATPSPSPRFEHSTGNAGTAIVSLLVLLAFAGLFLLTRNKLRRT